jgi:hypothetical protein
MWRRKEEEEKVRKIGKKEAPRGGLEPPTFRLTAERTASCANAAAFSGGGGKR